MPNEPTICAASVVACARSPPGPVPDSPKNSSSAVMPPNAILIDADELGAGARVALLVVGVREQAERVAALDDRQHLELAVLADEVRDDRVTGLVRRDRALLLVRVLDRLLEPDLLGHLRLLDVGQSIASRPSRSAHTSASSKRCSIITGE